MCSTDTIPNGTAIFLWNSSADIVSDNKSCSEPLSHSCVYPHAPMHARHSTRHAFNVQSMYAATPNDFMTRLDRHAWKWTCICVVGSSRRNSEFSGRRWRLLSRLSPKLCCEFIAVYKSIKTQVDQPMHPQTPVHLARYVSGHVSRPV